jgi:geranylgeranyl pyrophosphate synthase
VLTLPTGGWANAENMARLVEKIRNSNAPDKSMQEAQKHVDRALQILNKFDACSERESLESLAKFIVDRKI